MSTLDSTRVTSIIVGSIILLFVGYVGILWYSGLLSSDGTDSSVKIVSATMALIAAFVAAVFSLLGVLLKHSIEVRAEDRLQLEAERNTSYRSETEERLKLEAALRAVQLLTRPDGSPASAVQCSAALFMLVGLKQYALTIGLLATLLERHELDSATAADVLNETLRHGDASHQRAAILILKEHAAQMVTPTSCALPECLFGPWDAFPPYVRDWAPVAISNILVSRPIAEWLARKDYLLGLISTVVYGWQSESDPRIRGDIAAILAAILRALPELRHRIATPQGTLDLQKAWLETYQSSPTSDVGIQTIVKIGEWSSARAGAA